MKAKPAETSPPALELRGIEKSFGSVRANRSVSLSVAKGSIHGIVGENGAGKSTLMNVVYGLHRADAGEIRVNGRAVVLRNSQDAIAAGIGMVHQHFMLVENFTALENVILGNERGFLTAPSLDGARAGLEELSRRHGFELSLDSLVSDLPVGERQRVEIVRALSRGAGILILDEPTAVLTPLETAALFRMLVHLRDQGTAIVLVTHKLREVMEVCDRVTVMRQGAVVADLATRDTSPGKLAEKMIGRSVAMQVEHSTRRRGDRILDVSGLEVRDRFGVSRVKEVSFSLHAGEIVGIAGVTGNGQTELLEALAGIRAPARGEIRLGDRDLVRENLDARARRRLGLAHVPEDRQRMGMVAGLSAQENAILGYQDLPGYRRGGLLDRASILKSCRQKMEDFDVRPPEPGLRMSAFSGGNQQKLVLAREIDAHPRVLLVGQPTRGVDVGAIEFIHRRLVQLRDSGAALLIVSVELEEILALSDRILVMTGGRVAGELERADATEEKLGILMAGIGAEGSG